MKFEQTPQEFPKHTRLDVITGGTMDKKPSIASYDAGPCPTITIHVKGPKVDLVLENVTFLELFK